jgi:serine protease Do
MNAKTLSRSAVAVAVAVALSAGYVAGHRDVPAPQVITPAQAAMMPAEAAAKTGVPDFSGLVETYGPAVVNISAKHVVKQTAMRSGGGNAQQLPIDPNDPFYQFYKRFFGGMPGMQGGGGDDGGDQGDQPSASLGSGFIVSSDGYILTNAHVVDGANVVTVKLTDKREFRAKVVGADKQSDVAVLKIDASNLPIVKIGDPNQSKVGQWVVAIGSPYGFDNTVTSGIISAKSRSLPNENYTPFIQTDVPVNPGNSGGPLFNLQGEVIGINSMIYSQTGGFQGLSFAIPINEAIKVKDDLVSSVDAGGPAAKAGLQPGDVITAVNGSPVADSTDLPAQVASLAPGSSATVTVWRDKASKDIKVTIGSMSDTKVAKNDNAPEQVQGRLGVAVRPLTPEEKDSASVSHGLLVQQSGGAAENAGIQPGDVILAVNGRPVTSVDQLKQMISQAGNSIALLIQRDNAQIFVPVDLG